MDFASSVKATRQIQNALCSGLGALSKSNRSHIRISDSIQLAGSVDLDNSLRTEYPNESRWDYAIGHRDKQSRHHEDFVSFVEIHPANSGEVKVVIAKLVWLKSWLRSNAPRLDSMRREFVWLSSGRTTLSLSAPHQKQLAQLGLRHGGRVLKIGTSVTE